MFFTVKFYFTQYTIKQNTSRKCILPEVSELTQSVSVSSQVMSCLSDIQLYLEHTDQQGW